MSPGKRLLQELRDGGWEQVEIFHKRGRMRRFELSLGVETWSATAESGWALRAGRGRRSLFLAAAGSPELPQTWPEAGEGSLCLPEPRPCGDWHEPAANSVPLLGEGEGRRRLRSLASAVVRAVPGARVVSAVLEDGSSEVEMCSSLGLQVAYRKRIASLRVEALGSGARAPALCFLLHAATARDVPWEKVSSRLEDLLALRSQGVAQASGGGHEMVLAPEVAAVLLARVGRCFVGTSRRQVAEALRLRDGRVAAAGVDVLDDGRLCGGALNAPVDGEGVPTGIRTLIEDGRPGETIRAWNHPGTTSPVGCRSRPGWRDLPALGPTHLFLAPVLDVSAADLLQDLERGYYIVDAQIGDLETASPLGRFAVPVWGFQVAKGRAQSPIGGVRLVGDLGSLLHAVTGRARDLRFLAHGDAMFGSPSLRVTGLELVSGP